MATISIRTAVLKKYFMQKKNLGDISKISIVQGYQIVIEKLKLFTCLKGNG